LVSIFGARICGTPGRLTEPTCLAESGAAVTSWPWWTERTRSPPTTSKAVATPTGTRLGVATAFLTALGFDEVLVNAQASTRRVDNPMTQAVRGQDRETVGMSQP
jgi:hypothetical protein